MATHAAGPLIVSGSGTPLVWTADPVPFNPDQGTLGTLNNADAVTAVAGDFAVWTAVPTSSVSFTNAGALPEDVTVANEFGYLGVCGDSLSPIIFDTDGTITDDVLGFGASNFVLGFAGPECGSIATATITEGVAVLNGKWIDGIDDVDNPEIPVADFNAVFIHEFGHYVNLDHSQINFLEAFDGNPANDDAIATMFPYLVNGAATATLHLDDEVSVSMLYPDASLGTDYGTITGTILRTNGSTPFQGAYVIARNLSDPRVVSVGMASGARFFPFNDGGPPAPGLEGFYEIPGLPPGSYTVEVEEIYPGFTGGSSVGPVDPPAHLSGVPEFWNGTDEAGTNPPDDPSVAQAIAVSAATTVASTDIILNGLPPPPNDDCGTPTVIGSLPYVNVIDTSEATTAPTDPIISCGGFTQHSNSVWYSFTPAADGTLTIDTSGSAYDTVVAVWTGTCGAPADQGCNDDSFGLTSFLQLPVTAGQPLLVEVADYFDPGGGTLVLNVSFLGSLPPIPPGTSGDHVLYVGDASVGGIVALADTDTDLVADHKSTISQFSSPAGNAGMNPGEVDVDSAGAVIASDLGSDSVFAFIDADADYVADAFVSFNSGLGTDGDGLRVRRSDGVIFVSDAFGAGSIAAFKDTNNDHLPDIATLFAPGPGTIDPSSAISLDVDGAGTVYAIDVFATQILTFTDSNNDLVADSSTVFSSAVPNAVALKVDSAGRVYVADAGSGCIVVLQDTDADLVADTSTTFTCGLTLPFSAQNGLTVAADGTVYVIDNTTTILAFTDTNHDQVADGPAAVYAQLDGPLAGLSIGIAVPLGCGNGVLEDGEQCDDGNTIGGDCCNILCQYEPSGAICNDGNGATANDVCNGSGTCAGSIATGNYAVLRWPAPAPTDVKAVLGFHAQVVGDVCADTIDAQSYSQVAGDVVGADGSGRAVTFRRSNNVSQDVITGGGAIRGLNRAQVGGRVDTTGSAAELANCAAAATYAGIRRTQLSGLAVSPGFNVGRLAVARSSSMQLPTSGSFGVGQIVIDAAEITIGTQGVLRLVGSPSTQQVIVRVHGSMTLKYGARIELSGLMPGQVLFMVDGPVVTRQHVDVAGTLFGASEVRLGWKTTVDGQVLSRIQINLRQHVIVNRRAFVGW